MIKDILFGLSSAFVVLIAFGAIFLSVSFIHTKLGTEAVLAITGLVVFIHITISGAMYHKKIRERQND